MRFPSNMSHSFAVTPTVQAPRSKFDRTFGYKTTFNPGWLIPYFTDEVLPGDTFNLQTSALARLSTPLFPVMDNIWLDTHYFFVPTRLVWDNAKRFFGEQDNPTDSIDFALPVFNDYVASSHSLSDYLGLPISITMSHVSLYHRCYNLIWNEWFRDQNLQDSVTVDKGDGPDDIADYGLLKRGKRHDYITASLPWPQKGDAVSIPLGSNVLVQPLTSLPYPSFQASSLPTGTVTLQGTTAPVPNLSAIPVSSGTSRMDWANPGLFVDLSTATAATINDLREAFQVQKLLERDARSGTRYSELVRNHFGVDFYDVSVRPEYLGGGTTRVNVSPVATTTFGNTGDLGAFGTAAITNHGFTKSFVEHGFVIGLISVRADLTYQQGMERRFRKSTRYDIYWPSLAHLGEQAVENAEVLFTGTSTDDDVWGYQERYAEYRYKQSLITGYMRSTSTAPLDAWHLSQELTSPVTLGPTFIQESPPFDRIVATPGEPKFIFDSFNRLICARPMPVFGVPGLIDHF